MKKLEELIINKKYSEAANECDRILKKNPLSWDDKYLLLIKKIECLFKTGQFEKCQETLNTAKKIKDIYSYYYWKGLLELHQNDDLLSAEENFIHGLNITPFSLEKERGKFLFEIALIKTKKLDFKNANSYFISALELIPPESNLIFKAKFYNATRKYKETIKAINTPDCISEDYLILLSDAYRSSGQSKKAFRKLYPYYQKNDCQDFRFLKELFFASIACGKLIEANIIYGKIEMQCDQILHSKYYKIIKRITENEVIESKVIKKPNPPKLNEIVFYKNPFNKNLPDAIYSLLYHYKLENKLKDIDTKTHLHDFSIFKMCNYLKENNILFTRFKPDQKLFYKLIDKKIPFVLIKETPAKLEFNLICGYDKSYKELVALDDCYYSIPKISKKEDKLSCIGLLIYNKDLTKQINLLLEENKFEKNCNSFDKGIELYYEMKYEDALERVNSFLENEEAFSDSISLKFSILLNLNRIKEAEEIIKSLRKSHRTKKANLLQGDICYFKKNYNKALSIFKKSLNNEKNVYCLKAIARVLIDQGDYLNALEYHIEAYRMNVRNRDSLIQLGLNYALIEDYLSAWEYLNIALSIHKDSILYDHCGWVSCQQEEWNTAINHLKESIKLNENNPYAYSQLGFVYRNIGKSYKAISMLDKSIELKSNDPLIYNEIGYNYELLKQHRKAIQYFNEALETIPNDPYTLAHIGSNYGKIKLYEKAIEYLSKACDIEPEYKWAVEELTYYLRKIGDSLKTRGKTIKQKEYYEKSIFYLQKSLKIDKTDSWLLNELGYAYERLNQFDTAIKEYKNSLKYNVNDYSYAHIGYCYRNLHNLKNSIVYFKKALELNPDYYWAISELAYSYELSKNYSKALNLYYKALAIKPNDHYSIAHTGYIYLEKGLKSKNQNKENINFNKAIFYLKKAVEIEPKYDWALSELGYALRLAKNFKEAAVYLERAAVLNPRDEWICNELGYCFEQIGEHEKASKNFIRVIELDMNNSYAYAHLGHINRLMGNNNKAILYLIKATRLNPKYTWAVTELGICLREKGWYKTAIGIYIKAIKKIKQDSWILNDIGYCYEQIGEYDEAEKYFLRSSEISLNVYPIAHLGSINLQRKNYKEAEYYFKRSLSLNPKYNWAYLKLSELYDRKNDYSRGVTFLEELINDTLQDTDLILKKAYFLRKSGEYQKALDTLRHVSSAESIFEEAICFWLLKEPFNAEKKLEILKKNHKEQAKDIKFWEQGAISLTNSDETLRIAPIIIDIALNIAPNNYYLNVTKGNIEMQLNKYNAAIKTYKRCIRISPTNYIAWEKIANSFLSINEIEKAFVSVKKALSLYKNSSQVYSTYSKIEYLKGEKSQKIISRLNHAIALDNQNHEAYFTLSEILSDLGFYETSLQYIEKYLNLIYKGEKFLKGLELKSKIKKALKVQ